MTANGLSDEALAKRLGVNRSTISRVRRGKVMPSRVLIARLDELSVGVVDASALIAASIVQDATA